MSPMCRIFQLMVKIMEIWILEISYYIISWLTYIEVDGMIGYIKISTKTYSKLRTVEFQLNLIRSAICIYICPILPMIGNMIFGNLEGIPDYG